MQSKGARELQAGAAIQVTHARLRSAGKHMQQRSSLHSDKPK
jgi:hypothetical protein